MNNFIFGIQAIARGMSTSINYLTQFQLFWGFAIGFLVSTLVHGFLITDDPRHLPTMLFHDKSASFQKLHAQTSTGTYVISFSRFSTIVNKVKFIFGLAFALCAFIILLALLRF